MNQRSVDPEVQVVRLVRRRPMSTSNSAPQTAMRWVNADCALIRKSNQFFFFWSHWKRHCSFVSGPGTELGFRLMKSRNTIRVMMMMTMMIFNNWWSPCKWMVCSALWLIHQISMNSTKATYSTFARLLRLQAMQVSFIVFIPRLTENLTQAELFAVEILDLFLYRF